MGIFVSLLILSFLIFFHELGHFLAARYFGVHVEVFSIGFGKRILTRKIGATQYSLALIPLGGYVRMKGQDDANPQALSNDPDSYNTKKPWQRIIILLAGPFANFLLAFFLFWGMAIMGMQTLGTKVGTVLPDSPAQKAGLIAGDIIIQVNDQEVRYFRHMKTLISQSNGPVILLVERGTLLKELILDPMYMETEDIFKEKQQQKMIGITLDGTFLLMTQYTLFESIEEAWYQTSQASIMIFKGVQKLIEGVIPAKEIGGVISIVDITAKASSEGVVLLFFITALISVNLGVLNLLPIPALDGGHIMFNLYEILTRKVPSTQVMVKLTIVGWIVLFSLMGLGLYNDITRLLAS